MQQSACDPVSLKNLVYQRIVDMICDGELTIEAKITESQLTDRFQVSKAPIREALIQLCSENILRSIPRHGYQVVQITPKDIRELIQLRQYLELPNLTCVYGAMTSAQLAELRRLNAERLPPGAGKRIQDAWSRNYQFHMTLIRFGGNAQVERAMENALATCNRAYAQIYREKSTIIAPARRNFHDLIVQALEAHDLFGAHDCLKQDIEFMQEWIA